MLWLTFGTEDTFYLLNPSIIRRLDEVGDRLTITYTDGKVEEFDHVSDTSWRDNPTLDYWRPPLVNGIDHSGRLRNRSERSRWADVPEPVASDM